MISGLCHRNLASNFLNNTCKFMAKHYRWINCC